MALITRVPEPNIWDNICKDFAGRRPPFDDDQVSVKTDKEDYDPAKFTPVFYGKMRAKVETDIDPMEEFDPAVAHPACVGYALVDRPKKKPPPPCRPKPPNKKKCSPRQYLEHYVFPVLLPAMEEMLKQAKVEKCFERKRTKFNACDFITEYLYNRNKKHPDREDTDLLDIPFVQEWLKDHPRPPLPKSLLWSEEEAALIIQSFFRGYKVRREPEVQELRQWQREWRAENENIAQKVNEFWDKKMPGGDCEGESPRDSDDKHISKSAPTLVVHQEDPIVGEPGDNTCATQEENNKQTKGTAQEIEMDPDSLQEDELNQEKDGQETQEPTDSENLNECKKDLDVVT